MFVKSTREFSGSTPTYKELGCCHSFLQQAKAGQTESQQIVLEPSDNKWQDKPPL